jgi:hypothetical protein
LRDFSFLLKPSNAKEIVRAVQRHWCELGQLQHLTNDSLLKMLYLAMIGISKNEPAASEIGVGFI